MTTATKAATTVIPAWMTAPAKAIAESIIPVSDAVTSLANSTLRVALNIEGMIPLSEETVSTVVAGRKVAAMLR